MMGTLRSKTYRTGLTINGVQLGQPVIAQAQAQPLEPGDTISEAWFCWDDEQFPNGIVNADGSVTIDQVP